MAYRKGLHYARMIYADSLGQTKFIPTGLFIDKLTGGIPMGKIVIVSGMWSVGKSTLILQAVAAAQQQGIKCLLADVEFSYDPKYSALLGVDNSKLGIIQARTAEEVLDALEKEIDEDKFKLFVIDSVGALSSRVEVEKSAGEKVIAQQASLVSRFIRKTVPMLAMNGSTLICLSHEFTDLLTGRVQASGGAKLGFHASQHIRLKAKMGVLLKNGEVVVGKIITAELKKDKLGGKERAEVDGQLLFNQGFNKQADALQEALDKGLIEKRANSYYLHEEKIAVGAAKLRDWAKSNSSTLEELIKGI